MSVGSSRPRLGSIRSREYRVSSAGACSARSEMLGHSGSADVIGDMPAEILRRETESAIGGGNRILGVVAEKEHAAPEIPVDAPERRHRRLLVPQPIKPLLHR